MDQNLFDEKANEELWPYLEYTSYRISSIPNMVLTREIKLQANLGYLLSHFFREFLKLYNRDKIALFISMIYKNTCILFHSASTIDNHFSY